MKREVKLLNKIIFTISIILILMGVNISSFALESENIDIEAIKSEQENYSPYEDKPYSDEYLEYLSLSDEEKAKLDVIPSKEFIAVHKEEQPESIYSTMQRSILPSKYNLNDYLDISVENQEQSGWCGVYSTLKCIETYMQKKLSHNYNLAEYHVAYMKCTYFGGWWSITDKGEYSSLGEVAYKQGSGFSTCMTYAGVYSSNLKIKGPVIGTNDENKIYLFNEENKTLLESKQPVVKIKKIQHFSNISKEYENDGTVTYKNGDLTLSENQIKEFRNTIKSNIIENGAVYATIKIQDEYFDSTNKALYTNDSNTSMNHAIVIVGWDDNYSKSNFKEGNQPKNDGAYICLNSWGESWGDGGYFYISYDDYLVEKDIYGILYASDYAKTPEISVSYSTKEPTNGDVKVTITCDERIQAVSGWTLTYEPKYTTSYSTVNTTQTTLTKTFSSNAGLAYPVNIKTVNGGITYPQIISITNIDKTAPDIDVNYSVTSPTNGSVTVTITANEELQEKEGWTLSEDKKILTKEYKENSTETVTVKDLVGNEVQANIGINNIDKDAPQGKITYSTTAPTNGSVTVTIIANEELQEIEGWALSDNKMKLTKVYANNAEEKVKVKDLAGNEAEAAIKVSNIDRIAPQGKISYSVTSLTNDNVIVVILANEELQEIEGWTLSEDKLQLEKVYNENIEENVTVKDLAGNEAIANIAITNIDKISPEIDIIYSTILPTNGSVTVVITAKEELQEVEGWTLSEDKMQLTKVYEANIEENVIVKDLAGNETQEEVIIKNIVDSNKENDDKNDNDNESDDTNENGNESDDTNEEDNETGNTDTEDKETDDTTTDNYESNKTNSNTNDTQNKNTYEKTNNIIKYESIDSTTANKSIPYTGYKIMINILIPIITILFIIGIVEYRKYNKEK